MSKFTCEVIFIAAASIAVAWLVKLFSPFCAPGRSKSPPSMIRRVFLSLPGTGARYDLSAILRLWSVPLYRRTLPVL